MKKIILSVIFASVFLLVGNLALADEYVPNEIIIKLKENVATTADLKKIANGFPGTTVKRIDTSTDFMVLMLPAGATVEQAVRYYNNKKLRPEVEYAEPNYIYKTSLSPSLISQSKSFKSHLNTIGDYLNQAKYGQLIDHYAKSRSTGYLIGNFLGEGYYYPKSILKTEIKQVDYLVVGKKVLTKNQWNLFFTKVGAKKRGVVIARKVPTCSLNPQAVIFQVVKKNNNIVSIVGYLDASVEVLKVYGMY